MHWKLLAGCACSVALLLGACSSNNNAGTTGGSGSGNNQGENGDSGNGNGGGGNGGGTEPPKIQAEIDAETAVGRAIAEATAAAQPGATAKQRSDALALIAAARKALNDAVAAANKAVTDAEKGEVTAHGNAIIVQRRVIKLKSDEDDRLKTAEDPLLWFTRELARYALASGDALEPNDGANTVMIGRTSRTQNTSGNDDTQIANTGDDVITADKFKTIPYSAGKKVFSASGDEFKVGGYVGHAAAWANLDQSLQTGLKITNSGLEIRTGGLRGRTTNGEYETDYLDMRKKINSSLGSGAISGAATSGNFWDLKIAFDEPLATPSTISDSTVDTNWFGNGDFYWRGIVKPHDDQLDSTKTDYYVEGTFKQEPKEYKDLGTYEVWLSNHIGVDLGVEPAVKGESAVCRDGVRRTSCPDDDVNRYLDYAAYGLFVYTADPEALAAVTTTNHLGVTESTAAYVTVIGSRIQGMYFGYSAFANSDGEKTTDIGEAITGGTFRGQTLARAYTGVGRTGVVGPTSATPGKAANRFLRGDVTLTVNIAKGDTGTTNIKGELFNFEEWHHSGGVWVEYPSGFKVYMNANGEENGAASSISDDGTFSGRAKFAQVAGPAVDGLPALNPTITPDDSAGGRGTDGTIYGAGASGTGGVFEGSFYGDRANSDGLEAAGSWAMGPQTGYNNPLSYVFIGSFGAKQRPDE